MEATIQPCSSVEPRARTESFELSWPFLSTGAPAAISPIAKAQPPGRFFRAGERVEGTPFTVRRLLGQGGMGEVYDVEPGEDSPRRALKVLHHRHLGRFDLAARMAREARVMARFDHPNLPRALDAGTLPDGRPFLVMELLSGRDLRNELARHGAMPAPRAVALVTQALEGLAVAHAEGLVHRDIKLENLFLCDDGTLKVLDFGLAKALWAEAALTLPGVCFGTPRTMAPEQCALESVDARADLYAVGLALFELCVGRGPFDDLAGQHDAIRFAHCLRTPPRPSELAPRPLDPQLEAVILRALAKAPGDRFQSAGEMAWALRAPVQRPEAAPADALLLPARGRRRAWVPAVLSAVAVTFFALGMAFGRALPEQRAGEPAPSAGSPSGTSMAAPPP